MAELSIKERLQPSLLDRLADDEPEKNTESSDKRVLNLRQLHDAVERDLIWLFNATNLAGRLDGEKYPNVKTSVLNFGLPDLSGHIVAKINVWELEKQLKAIINNFEPRITTESLKVKVTKSETMGRNALEFEIEGDLWAQPLPLHLYLKTELDIETGRVNIKSRG